MRFRGTRLALLAAPAIIAPSYTIVNPEYEAIVNAFSVEPDDTRKELDDTLVGALIAGAFWSECDRIWVLAAHDAQAARVDWITASETLVEHGTPGPTFTTDGGYTSDGSQSYLATGFNPGDGGTHNMLRDDNHHSVWIGDNSAQDTTDYGASQFSIRSRSAADGIQTRNSSTTSHTNEVGLITTSVGWSLSQRSSGAGHSIYKDGVLLVFRSIASSALASSEFFIGGRNSAGLLTPSTHLIQIVTLGGHLGFGAPDAYTAFSARMAAL